MSQFLFKKPWLLMIAVFYTAMPVYSGPTFFSQNYLVPKLDLKVAANTSTNINPTIVITKPNQLLILAVAWKNTTAFTTYPTTPGLTWTQVGFQLNVHRLEIYRAVAVNPGTYTVTLTIPGGAKAAAILASFSNFDNGGTNGSSAFDHLFSSGTGSPTTGSVLPTKQRSFVIGFVAHGNDTQSTLTAGFTGFLTGSVGGSAASNITLALVMKKGVSPAGAPVPVPVNVPVAWAEAAIAIRPP